MHERPDRLPRVPFTRPVFFSEIGVNERPRRLLAGNVSHGGMFVRGETQLEPGTRVALSLEAKGKALPFAEGEVVWHSDAAEALSKGQLPGVGVKFVRFLHPRSTDLIDHLVHRKAALLPPDLANQVIEARKEQEDDDEADAPPADFMRQELRELSPAHESMSTPAWANEEVSGSSPPEAAEGEAWFHEPDKAPPSALDADDGARVGASVVLVGFLIAVALGLLWVIRRDAGSSPSNAPVPAPVAVVAAEPEVIAPPPAAPSKDVAVAAPAAASASPEVSTTIPAPAPAPAKVVAQPPAAPVPASAVAPDPAQVAAAPVAASAKPQPAPAQVAAAPVVTSDKPRPASPAAKRYALTTGAASAISLSTAADRIDATLHLTDGATVNRVFVLKSPTRVVVDLDGAKPKGSVKAEVAAPGVEGLRIGARDSGTRLVLDMSSEVVSAEATASGFTVRLR